jgi:hypothetical protein
MLHQQICRTQNYHLELKWSYTHEPRDAVLKKVSKSNIRLQINSQ